MDLKSLSNEELYLLLGEISQELLSRPKANHSKENKVLVRLETEDNIEEALDHFTSYGPIEKHNIGSLRVKGRYPMDVIEITYKDPRDAADATHDENYEVSYEEMK